MNSIFGINIENKPKVAIIIILTTIERMDDHALE